MPIDILMPALSPTMEEGKLAKWLKKEGDAVKAGDVIAEIETDKATMEVEAVDEGILASILVAEGTDNVKVNTPIARLSGDGEEATDEAGDAEETPAAQPANGEAAAPKAEAPAGEEPAKPATAAASAPPAPQEAPPPDPDVPEGTEMVTITVREALRDAMAEEMRRDK